jgi:protein SCO1/2
MKMNLPLARSVQLGLLAAVLTVQPILEMFALSEPDRQREIKQTIPDVELVDQDGKTVHLYQDLVKRRIAALSFVFTTCTTICPLIGANLGRLQAELGQSLGEDISLVSVSVDPATDTPQRMKAWGAQFGAKPGWSLLTGDQETVERLLKDLGLFTPDIQSHSPFLLLFNDRTGDLTRV